MSMQWITAETESASESVPEAMRETVQETMADSFLGRSAERIRACVRGPGGWKVIVWAGLIGMGLIFLSNFWPPDQGSRSTDQTEEWNAAAYTAQLEERLTGILAQIEGAGECQVMITLENARQYVYTDRNEVVTEIQPTVKGVMVVCAGANDETVVQRVQTAVQTVLHVTARRVCVTPSI